MTRRDQPHWPLSELFFDSLEVPAINRVGGWDDHGNDISGQQSDRGGNDGAPNFSSARVWCGSMSTGIAQRAFDMALDYVRQRKQFGKEIGRFQMVQNLIADMAIDIEAARLLTYRAYQLVDRGRCDADVSMAKAFATEMGVRVTSKAMECFGAMGLARETKIERLFRDARMMIVPDGTAQIQRLVIGRELTGFSALRG